MKLLRAGSARRVIEMLRCTAGEIGVIRPSGFDLAPCLCRQWARCG